jgi:hypothetical protein
LVPANDTGPDDALYADDQDHPIPFLDRLDLFGKSRTGGGGDLVIMVASPLEGDRRSLERLVRKLENYLSFIASDEFRTENGPPSPGNTRIVVMIDPRSSPAVFDLLERSKPWAAVNKATLVVESNR